jgi:ABC-type uncharacterized transport system permease subunit
MWSGSTAVVAVYLAYLWVGLLHALFVGATAFFLWGHRLIRMRPWLTIVGMGFVLSFFELYWKPLFEGIGLSVEISNPALRDYFGVAEGTDMVKTLRIHPMNVTFIIIQALLAYWIGRSGYQRLMRGDAPRV